MDWKTIMGSVVGSIILASLAFLFQSIGESKHNDDIQNIHIEYLRTSTERSWNYYDKDIDKKIDGLKDEIQHLKGEVKFWKLQSENK